ncbi:hypothetical protein DSO57_1001288 [Entomophthora muscae]|uniref:Uncharacterized protein n=1 Tax=Entomophthora muscae TaxID=34485 RepID=A0ACC2T964_9FUNG|nr:hypothetical protein DSO57_1001288 [Entomophthora muscae]
MAATILSWLRNVSTQDQQDVNIVANPLYNIYGVNKEQCFDSKAYINTLNILQLQDALVTNINAFENMTHTNRHLKLYGFAGSRLDCFLISTKFAAYLSSPVVIRTFLSDHDPVICYIDLAPPTLPKGALINESDS